MSLNPAKGIGIAFDNSYRQVDHGGWKSWKNGDFEKLVWKSWNF